MDYNFSENAIHELIQVEAKNLSTIKNLDITAKIKSFDKSIVRYDH